MPPSVRDHRAAHSPSMTSGSLFQVREREEGELQEARQKAGIRWLVTKAYNNKPPREFQDPYYRDHNGRDRIKPHLVHALANAELYCLAMSHLYEDPNYNNLNHWGVIQALSRKGVFVSEPSDCSLTETVLIQDSPLKMSAHMAVVDGLMQLFVRELVAPDRVLTAVRRFSKTDATPGDAEEALLLWMNQTGAALRARLENQEPQPRLARLQDLSDFADGVGLATVLALYCPEELGWSEISTGDPPSMSDSLANIQLFQRFCQQVLPYNLCYLSTEDFFYLHSSIKLCLQCLLADLFTTLEVRPATCVKLPGGKHEQIITVPEPGERGRSNGTGPPSLGLHRPDSRTEDEGFVVQRGRAVPTLASVSHRSASPASDLGQKERLNQDTKSEERGEEERPGLARSNSERQQGAAGRPSEARDTPRSYAGRRSRRNSVSENDSQISIENIGGSTENLSVLGRNPDKEMKVHSGRRAEQAERVGSTRRGSANHQTFDIRKHSDESNPDNDVKMFIDNKELEAMEKHEREGSPYGGKSSQYVNLNHKEETERKTSFADLRRKSQTQNLFAPSGINITYSEEKEDSPGRWNRREEPRTWAPQQQQGDTGSDAEMNDKLNSVRVKLEERRKRIEEEKRKMEAVMSRQRGNNAGAESSPASALQSGWLSERASRAGSAAPSPQQQQQQRGNYTNMNDSIHELQSDLRQLASQQSQIQRMMQQPSPQSGPQPGQYIQSPPPPQPPHNPLEPQPFYMSGEATVAPAPHQRRTWGQPQPIQMAGLGWPRYPGPPQPGHYPQYDQYGQPVVPRDQWGNPIQFPGQQPAYPDQQYYSPGQPYQPPGYQQPGPGYYPGYQPGPQPYTSPGHPGPAQPFSPPPAQQAAARTAHQPFRLHDSPGGEPGAASTPRGFSRPGGPAEAPHRLHTSVPAPAADDMAPQNVSFIQDSTDNDEEAEEKSISPAPAAARQDSSSSLTERLKRLNISRGDKTYRVQLHADGREPTALDSDSSRPGSRPTISSTFKERRRGSSEGSGPGSLSGPGSITQPAVQTKLTDQEIDTLNNMKTEVLKETGDPAKGFVISFDDDTPVKPKPVLKPRRLSKKGSRDESKSDPVMIMLDMNEDGGDSTDQGRQGSPVRKVTPSHKLSNGESSRYVDPAQWSGYGEQELRSPDSPVIPRFDIDPAVPLEPMQPLEGGSAGSVGSDSDCARPANTGLIIGDTEQATDMSEMAKKKEKIMLQSLRRQQQAEENRLKREEKARQKKEEEAIKTEEAERKKEEEKKRKEAILEAFKNKKEMEKAEEEGRNFPSPVSAKPVPKIRPSPGQKKPRPKTIHVDKNDVSLGARRMRGSSSNLSNIGASSGDLRRSESRGSLAEERPPSSRSSLSLATMGSRPPPGSRNPATRPASRGPPGPPSRRGSNAYLQEAGQEDSPGRSSRSARSMSQPRGKRDSSVNSAYGAVDRGIRHDSFRGSRESLTSRKTYTARRGSNASLYDDDEDYYYGGSLRDVNSYGGHSGRRKSSSTNYLGPGSLPARHRHNEFDDGASDVSSQASGWSKYSYGGGQRMYREPTQKSNRPIVMNAFEHAVFPGAVNKETRARVLEEIDACDCPHFLILFRDGKCQFRGLYAYYPDTEEVFKIYGTGPKQVTPNMFDKYFKYNSGGKKFTQIHTKSLTVTIDAFTIHNSLWLGKKTKLPDRRGMALVM